MDRIEAEMTGEADRLEFVRNCIEGLCTRLEKRRVFPEPAAIDQTRNIGAGPTLPPE